MPILSNINCKRRDKMLTLKDFVRWAAESMFVNLSEEKLDRITSRLIRSENYRAMLHELEDMIQAEMKVRWRRK